MTMNFDLFRQRHQFEADIKISLIYHQAAAVTVISVGVKRGLNLALKYRWGIKIMQ